MSRFQVSEPESRVTRSAAFLGMTEAFQSAPKKQNTSSSSTGGVHALPPVAQRRSWAWPYFLAPSPLPPPGQVVKLTCQFKLSSGKLCGQEIKWTGTAGSLSNHLAFVHDLHDPAKPSTVAVLSPSIKSFTVAKPSLQDRIVKLVCFDLKPIRSLEGRNFLLPTLCPPRALTSCRRGDEGTAFGARP